MVPFGCGAVVVNAGILLCYFGGYALRGQPIPSFQVKTTVGPGLATGTLWAIGNYFSIYATVYLGQAVGATSIQLSMLVAGLWGVFYYKEVKGAALISAWFLFAAITLAGVVLLMLYG